MIIKQKNILNVLRLTEVLLGGCANGKRWKGGTDVDKYTTECVVRQVIKQSGEMEWQKWCKLKSKNFNLTKKMVITIYLHEGRSCFECYFLRQVC